MDDYIFDALRNIIHDAIETDFISEDGELRDACECESITINFTDIGLGIQLGDKLYGIAIERV